MLTTLIYRSQLSLTCTSAALSALVEQARIRNTEQGISGILLSRGRDVLQILEGTEQSVVALFNTIRADDRHTGVVELMRDYGPRRRFEDVGMLLFDLSAGIRRFQGFLFARPQLNGVGDIHWPHRVG